MNNGIAKTPTGLPDAKHQDQTYRMESVGRGDRGPVGVLAMRCSLCLPMSFITPMLSATEASVDVCRVRCGDCVELP